MTTPSGSPLGMVNLAVELFSLGSDWSQYVSNLTFVHFDWSVVKQIFIGTVTDPLDFGTAASAQTDSQR